MAEIWGAALATVAVGAYAANKQAGAAKDAANASQNATDQSIAEQKREFDISQANQQPWLDAGKGALGQMQSLNSGDFSSFTKSPDYQFSLNQDLLGLDNSAAARGSLFSGGHSADVMNFAQGLASQNYNNYYNRLAGMAGVGQTTASNLGQQGMQMAGNVGNLLMGNASNQMGSIYDKANANSNMWNQLAGIGGNLAGQFYHPNTSSAQSWQMPQQDFSGGISTAAPGTGAYDVFNLG